jgi:hypothetical protein
MFTQTVNPTANQTPDATQGGWPLTAQSTTTAIPSQPPMREHLPPADSVRTPTAKAAAPDGSQSNRRKGARSWD